MDVPVLQGPQADSHLCVPSHSNGEGAEELTRAIARASEISDFVFLGMDSNGHSPLLGA